MINVIVYYSLGGEEGIYFLSVQELNGTRTLSTILKTILTMLEKLNISIVI